MSGLKLEQLSSNWKKLQEKLQAEKKQHPPAQSNGLKRKRVENEQKATNGFKKSKTDRPRPGHFIKKSKMGSTTSTPAQSNGDNATTAVKPAEVIKPVDTINCGLHPTNKPGKFLSLDCEMVGTGAPPYADHVLARASLVNYHGEVIYDSFVLPPPGIIVHDYRTHVSGILPSHLKPGVARSFQEVQRAIATLLEGKVLVGHALKNDLLVLELKHPRRDIRDTSRHHKYRIETKGKPPALRYLAKQQLGLEIQLGEHSSIEDARAAMALFKLDRAGFEEENRRVFGAPRKMGGAKTVVEDKSPEEDNEEDDDEVLVVNGDDDGDSGSCDEPAMSASTSVAKKKRKKKKRTKRK